MQYKIAFFDNEGEEYGVLDNVDENTTLSNLRLQGSKNLKFIPTRYSFIWKDTPISLRQETMFTVGKYAERKYTVDQTLKIVIAVNLKNKEGKRRQSQSVGVSTKHSQSKSTTTGEKGKTVYKQVKASMLKTFSESDLADPTIPRLEKERRCFWNDLSAKVDSHDDYKDWSLQARQGIVDTEWTLKKTELLKIDADAFFKRLEDNTTKNTTQANKVGENLDRLLHTELRRKSSYKKIEDLHENLKSSTADRHNIEKQIANEEDLLNKIFTELKASQSALEMAISRSCICRLDETVSDSDTSVDSDLTFTPALTEDETMNVVLSTMDDFSVECD